MIEKRFKLDCEVGFIDTQKCGGDTMTHFEVIVKLNKLNEENEQLKANYNSLSHNYGLLYDECINKINALKKENEELKKENNNLKKALWEAEENYLYEAYYDNSARREDKLQNLKEDFKRGYWND